MSDDRGVRWQAWMVASQAGDAPSYEKLLRELIPYLRRFVRRRLLDAAAAEDVVQNVLISVHRARHTYRPERPFPPWLHAIARNAVIDHVRAQTRRGGRELGLDDDGVPEPSVEARERNVDGLSAEMEAALESLSHKQREAVELIHLQGLTVAEAAARAGVTQSALKVRAHRGYRAMRAQLERASDAGELEA